MYNYKLIIIAFASLSLINGKCNKDEPEIPEIPNEEEVITTLRYILVPLDTMMETVTMTFVDLDGDGGNPPGITGGLLDSNAGYSGRLELLNELNNPAEDISGEVAEEAEDHQFFFESSVNGLVISYEDQDADGKPVGLETMISTGGSASGTIKITLRHEPDKTASGVADGKIDNAGGETDIEVTFPVDVK